MRATVSGTPLAFVCTLCALPCVQDTLAGRRWREAAIAGQVTDIAATRLLASTPVRKCSVAQLVDSLGVSHEQCNVCYARLRARACRGGPSLDTHPALRYQKLPRWLVAPAPMSAEWSCHALPGCNEEPQARGQDDVIDDLREARRSYSTLSDASLLDVQSLVTKHLSVTRPEKIYVTFPNGRKWTYGREVTPIKTVVGPRQTRRRASLAAAAVGRLVQVGLGLVTAMMQD